MSAQEIKEAYPFYNVDDILLGSINRVDEGYWDGSAVFYWWRRQAQERGVEYVTNEVVAMTQNANGTAVEKHNAGIGRRDFLWRRGQCFGPAGQPDSPNGRH